MLTKNDFTEYLGKYVGLHCHRGSGLPKVGSTAIEGNGITNSADADAPVVRRFENKVRA